MTIAEHQGGEDRYPFLFSILTLLRVRRAQGRISRRAATWSNPAHRFDAAPDPGAVLALDTMAGPTRLRTARQLYDSREHTVQEIADIVGGGRSTLYRALTGAGT